jgi:hypothetical protein
MAIYVFDEKVFHSSQMMGFLLVLIGKLNIINGLCTLVDS